MTWVLDGEMQPSLCQKPPQYQGIIEKSCHLILFQIVVSPRQFDFNGETSTISPQYQTVSCIATYNGWHDSTLKTSTI